MNIEDRSVSVVTPTFNAAHCLPACIESVKSQFTEIGEHIVVDGGSTDDTVKIAQASGCIVITEADAGLYHAMSKGILLAQGVYVHVLNADDEYSGPESMRMMLEKMVSEELDLCHALINQVNESGVPVRQVGCDASFSMLQRKMRVAHPSLIVRREVYLRWGTFAESFRVAADHDWVLRVWPHVKVGFLNYVVVDMKLGGVSNSQPYLSYKESLAVAIIHGVSPIPAYWNFLLELVKHKILVITGRLG